MSARLPQDMRTSAKRKDAPRWTARLRFVSSIEQFLLLLWIASLLAALGACSPKPPLAQMPAPPANLEANCPQLAEAPSPLLDPERLLWEMALLSAYADCSARHRMTVEAWKQARARLAGE